MDLIKTRFINKEAMPLVVEPKQNMKLAELLSLVKSENKFFKDHLKQVGVLLFRGFPIDTAEDFAALINAMGTGQRMDYIGGDSPRKKMDDKIYTSTEAPPEIKLALHNEMSFSKNYPTHIYFYCAVAPQDRGETIIGDARKIYNSIDSDVMKRFNEKGLKYVSRYYHKSPFWEYLNKLKPGHKSWIQVFETDSPEEVEKRCHENEFGLKWNKNGWVEVSQTRPSTMVHPETKENVWFNQAHLYDFNPKMIGWSNYIGTKILYCRKYTKLHEILYGDNSEIARRDLYHVLDKLDANTVAFPWQKGDVMLCDNILAMHGRNPFSGPRKILTAMTR